MKQQHVRIQVGLLHNLSVLETHCLWYRMSNQAALQNLSVHLLLFTDSLCHIARYLLHLKAWVEACKWFRCRTRGYEYDHVWY